MTTLSEARAAQLAMLTAALAVAHQVAAKSLREGLFLSTFSLAGLARQGLLSDDRKLRGTALEYLESLLHESVRSAVVAALAARLEPRAEVPRSETQLLAELKRSFRPDISAPTLALEPD